MPAPLLAVMDALYKLARPLIFTLDAQAAHDRFIAALRRADSSALALSAAHNARRAVEPTCQPVTVGGVQLPTPVILAAGLVKGDGFADETAALAEVEHGANIIPGWRIIPALCGAVEFGSYTCFPRLGNAGRVIWRDTATRSTQNRIGLKNPGARAAAAFLAARRDDLPPIYGINIAVSPGVTDPAQACDEAVEAASCFITAQLNPAWFTLNVSCPNTEDDPRGQQTRERTLALCRAVVGVLGGRAPLWLKISPGLGEAQLAALVSVCQDTGVRAIIGTNTLGQPTPHDPTLTAGVGGGRLHPHALETCRRLTEQIAQTGAALDVIGCGGVMDGAAARAFQAAGARAMQCYSALIYRGLLATWQIAREMEAS